MTNQTLAQASDIAVWATMVLLTVAMLAFAAHLAITGARGRVRPAAAQESLGSVSEGTGGGVDGAAGVRHPTGGDHDQDEHHEGGEHDRGFHARHPALIATTSAIVNPPSHRVTLSFGIAAVSWMPDRPRSMMSSAWPLTVHRTCVPVLDTDTE